jgi:hypothetical protein
MDIYKCPFLKSTAICFSEKTQKTSLEHNAANPKKIILG